MSQQNPLDPFRHLCSAFIRLNLRTGHDLYRARETRFRLGEDAVTDMNLIDLADRHRYEVTVIRFNRQQESRGGADWSWWFLDTQYRTAVGFRIQAKIVDWSTDRFTYLHYQNKNGSQTDTLIKNADENKETPLYCLFTDVSDVNEWLKAAEAAAQAASNPAPCSACAGMRWAAATRIWTKATRRWAAAVREAVTGSGSVVTVGAWDAAAWAWDAAAWAWREAAWAWDAAAWAWREAAWAWDAAAGAWLDAQAREASARAREARAQGQNNAAQEWDAAAGAWNAAVQAWQKWELTSARAHEARARAHEAKARAHEARARGQKDAARKWSAAATARKKSAQEWDAAASKRQAGQLIEAQAHEASARAHEASARAREARAQGQNDAAQKWGAAAGAWRRAAGAWQAGQLTKARAHETGVRARQDAQQAEKQAQQYEDEAQRYEDEAWQSFADNWMTHACGCGCCGCGSLVNCDCLARISNPFATTTSSPSQLACFAPFIDAGCWLVHAKVVQKKTGCDVFSDFVSDAVPWHCLVCHKVLQLSKEATRLPDYVEKALISPGQMRRRQPGWPSVLVIYSTGRGDGAEGEKWTIYRLGGVIET